MNIAPVNIYSVRPDSTIADKIVRYFEAAKAADQAAADFVRSLHDKCNFFEVDSDTIIIPPEHVSAGGVLGIVAPCSVLDSHSCPDSVIFEYIEDPEDASKVIFFPRIQAEIHYMKYIDALRLRESMTYEWDFKRDAEGKICKYIYKDVFTRMTPSDIRSVAPLGYNKPHNMDLELAIGTQYSWVRHDAMKQNVILPSTKDEKFAQAVDIYRQFQSLPVLRHDALLNILGAKSPGRFTGMPLFQYARKEDGSYLFRTNLILENLEDKEYGPIELDPIELNQYFNQQP